MYTTHFGLREPPFDVSPDPRFFYTNATYHEAAASLEWGIKARRGLILLTGDAGTGKTTILRRLMTDLEGRVRFGFVSTPVLDHDDLLSSASAALGVTVDGRSRLEKLAALNAFLISQFEAGGTVALLVDEAQDLKDEVLERLRVLSNLEIPTRKLLQIVLVGQPELEQKLSRPSLSSLKQRVAIHCRLSRLRAHEIDAYIRYRLTVAGHHGGRLFGSAAVREIAAYSEGFPRLINIICDNALLIAYAGSERTVSALIIREVAHDLDLRPSRVWGATGGGDSNAMGLLERRGAKGRPTRSWMGSIRFRPSRPVLAALSLSLAATAAVSWQAGLLVLASAKRGLESFRAGAASPQGPVGMPEHLPGMTTDSVPGRSAKGTDPAVSTREPVQPAADHGLSRTAPPGRPAPAAPAAAAAVAVRPDSTSLPLFQPPRDALAARRLPPDPARGTRVSLEEVLRPPFVTSSSQSTPGWTASIELPPRPPSTPDPLGPGRSGAGADRSPVPRGLEESSDGALSADGAPGSVLPARPPAATPRTWTAPERPGPPPAARGDAANSGGEIIDWLLNERRN